MTHWIRNSFILAIVLAAIGGGVLYLTARGDSSAAQFRTTPVTRGDETLVHPLKPAADNDGAGALGKGLDPRLSERRAARRHQ